MLYLEYGHEWQEDNRHVGERVAHPTVFKEVGDLLSQKLKLLVIIAVSVYIAEAS